MAFRGRDKTWLRGRRAIGLLAVGATVMLGLATGGTVTQAATAKPKPTHTQIQLLAINDFHGQPGAEPPTSSSGRSTARRPAAPSTSRRTLKQLRAAARPRGNSRSRSPPAT